jgi:phage-related protein
LLNVFSELIDDVLPPIISIIEPLIPILSTVIGLIMAIVRPVIAALQPAFKMIADLIQRISVHIKNNLPMLNHMAQIAGSVLSFFIHIAIAVAKFEIGLVKALAHTKIFKIIWEGKKLHLRKYPI